MQEEDVIHLRFMLLKSRMDRIISHVERFPQDEQAKEQWKRLRNLVLYGKY